MLKEPRKPYRERVDFSKIKAVFPMPDLLYIQTPSYAEFLQMELLPEDMELSEKEVCPFCGAARKSELPLCEHCGDRVGLKIKYTPMECIQKGYTYSIPLKLKVQLVSWEKDATTKAKRLKHIKQQEVYFGDTALMTEKGTFIFNGIERVVVSQLQRSPGVFFRQVESKGFFIVKLIPHRGAWVEFEYDHKK